MNKFNRCSEIVLSILFFVNAAFKAVEIFLHKAVDIPYRELSTADHFGIMILLLICAVAFWPSKNE